MSYVEKHLIEGEKIIYETRLHWIVLVAPLLLGLLFGLTAVAMFVLSGRSDAGQTMAHESLMIVAAAFLAISLVFIVRGILMRNATEMTVTNKRVFVKVGLAARRTVELLLSRVESIGVEESSDGENARLWPGDRPRNRRHARGFQLELPIRSNSERKCSSKSNNPSRA